MLKNKNMINVGKIMRENTKLRVSPSAVQEYLSRIVEHIEQNMPEIEKICIRKKRKTITDEDIIEFFSYIGSSIT